MTEKGERRDVIDADMRQDRGRRVSWPARRRGCRAPPHGLRKVYVGSQPKTNYGCRSTSPTRRVSSATLAARSVDKYGYRLGPSSLGASVKISNSATKITALEVARYNPRSPSASIRARMRCNHLNATAFLAAQVSPLPISPICREEDGGRRATIRFPARAATSCRYQSKKGLADVASAGIAKKRGGETQDEKIIKQTHTHTHTKRHTAQKLTRSQSRADCNPQGPRSGSGEEFLPGISAKANSYRGRRKGRQGRKRRKKKNSHTHRHTQRHP